MKDTGLFQAAMGLTPPWQVVSVNFDMQKKRLDIQIDFPKGSVFRCPVCSQTGCKAYDTEMKSWRHLNFFQHETYLTARVPRVDCPNCGPKTVEIPWARSGSGFTLFFEAMIMALVQEMPVKAVGRLIGEHDTRLWRVLSHYVDNARDELDLSQVSRVGVDETSNKKGHDYISVFVDLGIPKVIFATEGKDSETVENFVCDLTSHNGDPGQITDVCCDMSPAFINGIEEHLPGAQITFDKFHITKIINHAVDEVRRQEQKDRPELKKSRYIWLKNQGNLTKNQTARLEDLVVKKLNLKTARAYHIRINFQELWNQAPGEAETFLKKWYFWATHSRLEPIIDAAKTVKRHWNGILRWFSSRINNGILEGIIIATEAYYTSFSVTANRKYYVNIKVKLENTGELRLRLGGVTKTITETGDYEYIIESTNTDTLKLDSTTSPGFTGKITSLQVKQENKYLKRNVVYTSGFNFQLDAASWETTAAEYEFNVETVFSDNAFVVNKTISFDTLDIPDTAEYVWSMRLKEMRNEAGTNIISNYALSYTIMNNYLEFLPDGTIGGQADIQEYGSDNDEKSSVIFDLDTYLGDGISATTNGALKVKEDAGTFKLSNTWDVANGQGFNKVTQLLVNEVIKGQLRPLPRMIDMPFQNLSIDNVYLPHKVIEYSGGYYIFERGLFDLNTDIWKGDFFKIDDHA